MAIVHKPVKAGRGNPAGGRQTFTDDRETLADVRESVAGGCGGVAGGPTSGVAGRRASPAAVCESWPQMTDAKREALKIPLRGRGNAPAALPAAAPTATVVLTGPESVLVRDENPAEPDRAAKPRGVKSLVVLVAFTGDGSEPALATDQWPVAKISGRTSVDLMWPNMPADQTAWVACYWLSTRNAVGPISRPQSICLPGTRVAVRARPARRAARPR